MKKTAIFGFRTDNIGDDMQAYAAACHLPGIHRLVNRDRMFAEELTLPHQVIFNSWFMQGHEYGLPAPEIEPIIFGFCVGNENFLTPEWLDYLRARQPIACRDHHTVDVLTGHGIEAYWSGCLTLFFGRMFKPVPRHKRNGVLFVDISEEAEREFIPETYRKQAVRISNFPAVNIRNQPLERFAALAKLCDQLRHAELVVSRRLHVVLPCVGFQTPAVALPKADVAKARNRFRGFDQFLNIGFQEDSPEKQRLDWNNLSVPKLPAEIERTYEQFRKLLATKLGKEVNDAHELAYIRDTLTLENPGMGFEPGAVTLKFGKESEDCPIVRWTDKEIEIRVAEFATMRRWDLKVTIQTHKSPDIRKFDLWKLVK
jgi:hypothetical protein